METMKLYNGVEVPANGFGVYQVSKEDCKESVLTALKTGYRHIDTAQSYFNESEVGEALKESDVPRKEIFLTTKVWIDNYGEGKTYDSVVESLKKLQTDYLDLILLHQPVGDYYAAYRDLEKLYEEGKVRAIGVSNFYPDRLVDLCMFAKIKPMVNQVELHPYYTQEKAIETMKYYDVIPEAWAPLGGGRYNPFEDEMLKGIAAKYNKSVGQVLLRWNVQRGVVVVPKSTHVERIKENIDIFDFELNEEEMKQISSLDMGYSGSRAKHFDVEFVEMCLAKKIHD